MKGLDLSRCHVVWITTLALLFGLPPETYAQWTAGAGYQRRAGTAGHGLHMQVQHSFETGTTLLRAFARAHGAYFFLQEERTTKLDYEAVVQSRRYDAAVGGGVRAKFAHARLYTGASAGYEHHRGKRREAGFASPPSWTITDIDGGSLYVAGYVGLAGEFFEGLLPYVEYRRPRFLNGDPRTTGSAIVAAGVRFQF